MSVLTSFMESYNTNLNIGTVGGLDEFFADAKPVSTESMIESIYEMQYGCEAVLVMAEHAINLQEATGVLNEGIVIDAITAIKDKIVEQAQKLKGFVVTVCKKIVEFFKDMYAKAAPLDKILQATNKKPVTSQEIDQAKANGWKFNGRYYLIGGINLEKVASDNVQNTIGVPKSIAGGFSQDKVLGLIASLASNRKSSEIEQIKDDIKDMKENIKDFFDNLPWEKEARIQSATGGTNFKEATKAQAATSILYRAGVQEDDQDLSSAEWKLICDYALNGQSKSRTYIRNVQRSTQKTISEMEKAARGIKTENRKRFNDGRAAAGDQQAPKDFLNKMEANVNQYMSYMVQLCTIAAQFEVKVCNKVILPIMQKQHHAAVSTFVHVQGAVKRTNKKADKI